MNRVTVVSLLLSATGLYAQASHQIPERGAAFYRRAFKREVSITRGGNKHKHTGMIPSARDRAVILHSDLDRKARRFERPPTALLQVAPFLAFDLVTLKKKKFERRLPNVEQFGPLRITGRVAHGKDGAPDVLTAKVEPGALEKGQRKPQWMLDATLKVTRTFDAAKGVVTKLDASWQGQVENPNQRNDDHVQAVSFTLHDVWTLEKLEQNRSAKFRHRVAEAIRTGCAFLKKQLGDPAKKYPGKPDERNGQTQASGRLALILLTLLRSGETPFDKVLKPALDELRRREITDTYSLGVALLTLEACYTPPGERDDLMSGRIKKPRIRKITGDDKVVMTRWVNRLLENQTESKRETLARWHYLGGNGFDNSCSQYAVLGLYAAQLCGIEFDQSIFANAARHFLKEQEESKKRVRFRMTTHEQLAKYGASKGTASAMPAAGWSYTTRRNPPTGSMTCAGIGSLTICDTAMRGWKRRPRDVSTGYLRGAVRAGFAWLAENYDVRGNPGHGRGWYHYYLYGMERACELNTVAHLNGKDWYFDGATLLLDSQNQNGAFGSPIDTCFAVLFLKKAALPVITGK